ncbi:Lysine-specific demethylase 4C [Triplophysa tibetana]|uniref:[histone H3]-trimethyl-L-lysine(9) demethylase n=1 Tax=Triplophysa tibetana TaxID=1572043 RepID=A0A5A9PKR1_9TELE|nr:Lysine-specific demethylase 4C [Triplophysa tibetana]
MAGVGANAPANVACKIMTFRPTMEEFKDFNQYLVYMESQGAHRAGLAKVIPPKGWKPRQNYEDIDDFVIQAPIQQMVAGQSGLFTQYNIQKKPLTVKEFRRLANSDMYCTPRYLNYEDLERKYWKNLTFVSPIYGADVSGTLYDEGIEEWNIGHLNSILDVIEEDCGVSIQGVNTPYLYFGMWKTSFSWHTEDMDLYSINYLHFGEPKSWYAIPPEHGKRLERLAIGKRIIVELVKIINRLFHKTITDSTRQKQYTYDFVVITQEAGEFMITFPYGYHAGFNHGFNCAESTNFASIRWINYGKVATQCTCSKDMVKISMDPFVRRFQPDRYQAWTQGKDACTLDHTLATPSTTPELQSWIQRRRRKTPATKRYEAVDDINWQSIIFMSINSLHYPRFTGPCRQMCVVKVTRVESDLLAQSTRQLRDSSLERTSTPPLTATSCQGDPEHAVSQTSVISDEGPFVDSKPFTSTIWKNLNSQSPAVLIESLQPELVVGLAQGVGSLNDYTHDSLSYTMWSESNCQQEKSSDSPNSSPCMQAWGNLGPGSTHGSGSEITQNLQKVEVEEGEACVLGEQTDSQQLQAEVNKSQEYYEGVKSEPDGSVSDSDSCESRVRGVDSSSESSDENALSDPECGEAGLEPGEVCTYHIQPVKKTTKSWRHPLRKPTARAVPSAVKQQAASDDETMEECESKEEEPETEDWAKPLVNLWQHRKAHFQYEREFNMTAAQTAPHCAVCTLFMPYCQTENLEERRHEVSMSATTQGSFLLEAGSRSRPLIPEICFAYEEGPCPLNTLLEEDGSSPLVACDNCCVQVHASCYGVPAHDVGTVWTCDRCVAGDLAAGCCLCNLRGGALKRTMDDRWAHVMCAVGLPEVKFLDVVKRAPIDISAIPVQRYKLKCVYCRNRIKRLSGACIQCSCGRCPTSFHVTCAHAAGVPMEPDDWPYVVFITCHRHQSRSSSARMKVSKSELVVGQTVISKHKNLRYYSSRITQVTAQTFYEVMFDDGSFSNDTFPEDIVSRDCAQFGAPEVGEAVQVKWPDGLFYGAKYLGSNTTYMYQVEFEDGSQVLAKREDIYTLDEDLPKKVKGRLLKPSCKCYELIL